jgi:WD40 repeat protein
MQRPLPDGKRVLTLDTNGTYAWWDAASGELRGRVYTPRFTKSVAIAPDMESVAAANKSGELWVMRPGGVPAVKIPTQGNEVTQVAFSPDGKHLFSSEAGRVEDAPDGSNDSRSQPAKPVKSDPAKADPYGIYRWDIAAAKRVAEYRGAKSEVHSFAITPDGGTLVAMTEGMPGAPATVHAWDLKTGAATWSIPMPGGQLNAKDYRRSRHHGLLLSADGARGLWQWWDVAGVFDPRTGKAISTLDRHKNAVHVAAFDPDGKRVWTAVTRDAVRAYDATTGRLLKTVSLDGIEVGAARFVLTPTKRTFELIPHEEREWIARDLGD